MTLNPLFAISIVPFILFACGDIHDNKEPAKIPAQVTPPSVDDPKNKPKPATQIAIDSAHIKAEKMAQGWYYEIKQPAQNDPIFIYKGNSEIIKQIEATKLSDIQDLAYILIPKTHWLATQNPFHAETSINLARRSLWDFELIPVKVEKSSVLFRLVGVITEPALKILDPNTLFPNYTAAVLGKGGVGTVYRVNYRGTDYVLKENAKEYLAMERLFFTRGVLETYGSFTHNNQVFMLMPLVKKSLQDKIANKEPIDLLVSNIEWMANVIKVAQQLNIDNNDIKPDNILITNDGLKFIDITSGFSPGYAASAGVKLLHSLLEGLTHKSFKGGSASMSRYYEFNQVYRDHNVASGAYLEYYFQYICQKEHLSPNCSTIKTYEDLFPLFTLDKLKELADAMDVLNGAGTKDVLGFGIYETLLDYPWLKEEKYRDYNAYFLKKDTIVTQFCDNLNNAKADSTNFGYFFYELKILKPTYIARCADDPGNPGKPVLLGDFSGATDQIFKDFVMDAFKPAIQLNSFYAAGAIYDDRVQIFGLILDQEAHKINLKTDVKTALEQLLNL